MTSKIVRGNIQGLGSKAIFHPKVNKEDEI